MEKVNNFIGFLNKVLAEIQRKQNTGNSTYKAFLNVQRMKDLPAI